MIMDTYAYKIIVITVAFIVAIMRVFAACEEQKTEIFQKFVRRTGKNNVL